MIEGFIKNLEYRIKKSRQFLEGEKYEMVREQEISEETPVIMNEMDFLEPMGSNQKPVDMYNISDKENLKRREKIIDHNNKLKKLSDILFEGKNV